jgi:hypothetical protein
LHPRFPGGLHFGQILLNIFNQEFTAKFEVAIAVVPFEGVDLPGWRYRSITRPNVFSARLRRMPGMRWQQVHFALAHNNLSSITRDRIDQFEGYFTAQLNEQLFPGIVVVVRLIVRSADHHHHKVLPVLLPKLPIVNRRQQCLFVLLNPIVQINRAMFENGAVFEYVLHARLLWSSPRILSASPHHVQHPTETFDVVP